MRKKRTVIVGGFINRRMNLGGETLKNEILARFLSRYSDIAKFDTDGWEKNKLLISIKLLSLIIRNRNSPIILSAADNGAITFLKLAKKIKLLKYRDIYYLVIGGYIHNRVKNDELLLKCLNECKCVCVESSSVVKELSSLGVKDVLHLPNFKDFSFVPKQKARENTLRAVFFSRVCREKGVEIAIEAVNSLSSNYDVKLDIYGPVQPDYKEHFESLVASSSKAAYLGILKPDSDETYEILSNYDLMLFPTYHEGEGFPGVVIDAYISGLPVIASDWKYNSEIIVEGVTGWLVSPKEIHALEVAIKNAIENRNTLKEMKVNCVREAKKYHVNNVLPKLLSQINGVNKKV